MSFFSRREILARTGAGFGLLGLASVLNGQQQAAAEGSLSGDPLAPHPSHFAPRAKHVIHLFMNGGPSHVDTFDPKPELVKQAGQPGPGGKYMPSPFKFAKRGESGVEVGEFFPHVGECIDDICVIRSMHTTTPNHEPGLFMMNSGTQQPTRPCLGSWLTYGLGTENQNLPGFVVLCPGKPVVGPASGPTVFSLGSTRERTSTTPSSILRRSSGISTIRSSRRPPSDGCWT